MLDVVTVVFSGNDFLPPPPPYEPPSQPTPEQHFTQ